MVSDALRRLQQERRLLADRAAWEREQRRLQEVRAAFFEGMKAGNDFLWCERPPEEYWLESETRQRLYAGPPLPNGMRIRARARPGYSYDPERDPGQVVGESYLNPKAKRKRP